MRAENDPSRESSPYFVYINSEALPASESLEHQYWVSSVATQFQKQGYEVTREHQIEGNGAVDLLATCQRAGGISHDGAGENRPH